MDNQPQNAIYWQGEIVGYMKKLQVDMFHWYGTWVPSSHTRSQLFLETLNSLEEDDGPLWVGFGEPEERFTIQFPPDERNEIDLVWRGNSQESGK